MARDDFKTEVTDYNVNDIYTNKATDKQGHSVNLRCNIPTHWGASINEYVQHPDWPEYNSMQAFIRDAIYHRLNWAAEQSNRGQIESVKQLKAIELVKAAIARHGYYRKAYEDMMEELQETFRSASVHQDPNILTYFVEEVETAIKEFPEQLQHKLWDELDYWKRKSL